MKKQVFFAALLLLISALHAQDNKYNYKVINKFAIGGEGGWDYVAVDAERGKVFLSHGSQVDVVDEKTGKVVATIPDTKGVHGIAINSEFEKGYISNGRDSSITIFDLNTYKTITKVQVTGQNPDAIVYDPHSHRVFAFNGRTKNATVMDAHSNSIVGTIELDGKPEFAVSDENGKIFVNIEDKNEITVINSLSLKVENNWPIAPGEGASGLAVDRSYHRLFTVCDNKLMVILDAKDGKVLKTFPICDGPDAAAYDPMTSRIYASCGDGQITVVQQNGPDNFNLVGNFPTMKGARTLGLDGKTHHLYLPTAEYGDKPEPTKENPHPRAPIKPGTFVLLEVAP
jgi:DNA-binding beta-propeller fold protein YncE